MVPLVCQKPHAQIRHPGNSWKRFRPRRTSNPEEFKEGQTLRTIVLLVVSNIFRTFAWYGHLKYREVALWKVVLISWGIAFFEYCFQVPANRIGSYEFNAAQLKTIQEVITLSVFSVFSIAYLGEPIKWNYLVGFGFITLAAFFIFHKW
jgi:uncharacterized protein